MPSPRDVFVLALLAGAGFAIAHYFGSQIAAKVHQLLTWIAGGVHPAVAQVVAPVPVTSPATSVPTVETIHVTPWDAAAAFVAFVPGDANGAGMPNGYERNWLDTITDAAFKALLTAALGPMTGAAKGEVSNLSLGSFAMLNNRQWVWLATLDQILEGRVGRL